MEDVVTNTGNTVGAIASLPMVTPLYSIPEIAGATNLLMGYEGFNNLASDDGVKKTYNLFKNGDYLEGTKSLGGDIFDVTMSLPFLNRVRRVSYNAAKPSILGYKLSRMPLGEVETPEIVPEMRYRLGDIEINDPNLNYRQGTSEIVKDFQKTGEVRTNYEGATSKPSSRFDLVKSFNSPMFK
jgi:hypothetical protein